MGSLLDSEPSTYKEASKNQCWRDVMTKEYESIWKNDVLDIVPKLEGKSIVTPKWIFKIKYAIDGNVEKYKVRFAARAFSQREGVDYGETFTPDVRFTSICIVIALASTMRWRYLQGCRGR